MSWNYQGFKNIFLYKSTGDIYIFYSGNKCINNLKQILNNIQKIFIETFLLIVHSRIAIDS